MDAEGPKSDDLDVHQLWRTEEIENEPARAQRQDLALKGRAEALQAALASIALRIDALTSTSTTFRNLVSDRLTDVGEQVSWSQSNTLRDLDDYRRSQERALSDIDAALTEGEGAIHRLDRGTAAVAAQVVEAQAALLSRFDRLSERLEREVKDASEDLVAAVTGTGSEVRQGIEALEESTSGALTQLAARIESSVADLHRRLSESVETSLDGTDLLIRLEVAVNDLATRPITATATGDTGPVLDGLRSLADQVEALRRRIALRARPAPALDEISIGALADAVVARLKQTTGPGPGMSTPTTPEEVPLSEEPPLRRRSRRT